MRIAVDSALKPTYPAAQQVRRGSRTRLPQAFLAALHGSGSSATSPSRRVAIEEDQRGGSNQCRGPGGARRRAPAEPWHQARAETLARVPVELRGGVQLHQRLDGHLHADRTRVGGWRTVVLLVLAADHRRPAVRGPELRRAGQPLPGRRLDLPVVEATVEPDPRLLHGLDLLLGRRADGDGGGRNGAARPVEHLWLRPERTIAHP